MPDKGPPHPNHPTCLPDGPKWAWGISEQLYNVKRMRLALVSASGTPTTTNLPFLASSGPRDIENRIPWWKMIHFDGVNVSECGKYDLLIFCEMIFGESNRESKWRFQVSGLRSQVSGLRSQVYIHIYIYIYILYKYIEYLALKTIIIQQHIK